MPVTDGRPPPTEQQGQESAEEPLLRPVRWTRFFRPIFAVTGLVCTSIVCIAFVFLVFRIATSRELLAEGLWIVGAKDYAKSILYPSKEDDSQRAVQSDQDSVVGWVLDCTGARTASDFPVDIQQQLQSGPTSTILFRYDKPAPDSLRPPNHLERALLTLSKSLSTQRLALRERADSAFSFWETTSIVTITLGMFTTILVSLSSTEFGRGDGTIQRIIRVLAIVFPALGTAAAAAISFYSPQAEWSQASRTLASLTQLHGQVAIGVWKLRCIKADNDETSTRVGTTLDEWSRRYVDIQTVSTASPGSTAAGGSSAQQPAGAGGGPSPAASGAQQPAAATAAQPAR